MGRTEAAGSWKLPLVEASSSCERREPAAGPVRFLFLSEKSMNSTIPQTSQVLFSATDTFLQGGTEMEIEIMAAVMAGMALLFKLVDG